MTNDFELIKIAEETVVKKVVEKAINSFLIFINNNFTKKEIDTKELETEFGDNIILHFNEIFNWSKELEFVGLNKPISTVNTINLSFYFSLQRGDKINREHEIDEDAILSSEGNIVIEGNPGSGKTTTIKRLISHYFFSQNNKECAFIYPLLIRLRAVEAKYDLYTYICHLLGLKYDTKSRKVTTNVKYYITEEDTKKKIEKFKKVTEEIFYHQINDIDIDIFIANLLDQNRILLVLDGIDELDPLSMNTFQSQIKDLSIRLVKSKMLITTRPNYIDHNFSNCCIYQVNELSVDQMRMIAQLWIEGSDDFFTQLKTKPYYELSNRPLFLSFLLLLYSSQPKNRPRTLPRLSKEVYEKIIELLLIRWDEGRSIIRTSEYSDFTTQKKINFLSELSFRLTYIIKQKVFSHELLVKIYLAIHEKFDLPHDEAELVAKEMESHTGIIIKSFHNTYEFSHLAIQEYLCALYIVKAPFNDKIKDYIIEYPAPLAIAVGLSSDSSEWLYELVLKITRIIENASEITKIFTRLLDRICLESPYFAANDYLAKAIMLLCQSSLCTDKDFLLNIERLITSNNNVIVATQKFLENYVVMQHAIAINRTIFKKRPSHTSGHYPDMLVLPLSLLEKFTIVS